MRNKKFVSLTRAILTVCLVVIFSAGSSATPASRNLVISLEDKKITEVSPEGLTLSFYPSIKNNSDKNYVLVSYFYGVAINSHNFFEQQVALNEEMTISSRQTARLHFPVKISYQYLPGVLSEGQKQATCFASGEMFFRNEKNRIEKVPFTFAMEFPLFKLPVLTFLPLNVKDLTLGGAEFVFSFQLKNQNSYDLLIQTIGLELRLADHLIYQGEIAGDKALEPGGLKTFSLPLMLDFFEMGRELRDNLEKELVPFNLRAEITADSAWGMLPFTLDKSDSIRKEKAH
ncbi:MAG: hypothetical protein PHU81_06635 [Acidobacteriota bacterium]|nr:hypothetical protein [Acidobacteriota bacterium]